MTFFSFVTARVLPGITPHVCLSVPVLERMSFLFSKGIFWSLQELLQASRWCLRLAE